MKNIISRMIYFKGLLCLILVLILFSTNAQTSLESTPSDPQSNCIQLRAINTDLPIGYNVLFAGSGECLLCHNSMTGADGQPIGILDDWRSTMMANAGKDPFWRAKVSHETLVNPEHKQALEDVCSRCHAPLGNFDAHHLLQEYYSIEEMTEDSLALDGVSCTLCHQIAAETLGSYSGNLIIGELKQIWGPYTDPFTPPMFNHTGYTAAYGQQIKSAAMCGSCHTLITNSVDVNGVPTGSVFVEQAIYHEWLNSNYPESGTSCQTCHIPEISDTVKISAMPPWLDGRSPFGQHHLAGANIFMQKILQGNIEELGITAEASHFDSTLSLTERMLKQATVDLELSEMGRTLDTLSFNVMIKNLAGHKFPAGFPSRRVYLELLVKGQEGDTLFHSGRMDEDFNLIEEDPEFEPHHLTINSEAQVQIYEMVMGNTEGEVTTILERAYEHLKDNRIPPEGFLTTHVSYDTVEIAGDALLDPDFNKQGETEGTGSDLLAVHIPINGITTSIEVITRVHYQTVSPRWLSEMFSFNSDEIDAWKSFYNEAEKQPVLVKEESFISLPTKTFENNSKQPLIYPNPTTGDIWVDNGGLRLDGIVIYGANGTRIKNVTPEHNKQRIELSGYKGLCFVKLDFADATSITRKVIVY